MEGSRAFPQEVTRRVGEGGGNQNPPDSHVKHPAHTLLPSAPAPRLVQALWRRRELFTMQHPNHRRRGRDEPVGGKAVPVQRPFLGVRPPLCKSAFERVRVR